MKSYRDFIACAVILFLLGGPVFAQATAQQPSTQVRPATQYPWILPDGKTLDWNAEKRIRKLVTKIGVVHHAAKLYVANPKDPKSIGLGLRQLSNDQKERLYRPRFETSKDPEPYLPGTGIDIQSGHYSMIGGVYEQTFFGYTEIILIDGTFIPLNKDDDVTWNVGNWDINMTSFSIVLDGDYSVKPPPKKMLEVLAKRIAYYRAKYPIEQLKGHWELRPRNPDGTPSTACPGKWWSDKARQQLWDKSTEILLKRAY